ncbi:MAG: sodium:proton antiporter [Cyclobacteriaceae bacterium]
MLELAGIIILGILAQWVAWKFKIPAILPLILTGLVVGPISTFFTSDGTQWLQPIFNGENGLFPDDKLFNFVSLAIGIILFEGGLTLRRGEISKMGPVVGKLILFGSIISFIGAGLAAHFLFDFSWRISFLFSSLIIVTGPTVINPILRNLPLKQDVAAVLKWEGILIDPLGALVAVLVFNFISVEGDAGYTSQAIFDFGKIVFIGFSMGVIMGWLLYFTIKKGWVPPFLLNPFSLSFVLLTFVLSDQIAHESSLLAVVVMGMFLGNSQLPNLKELLDFKETLSVLLISILFILLSANISLEELLLVYNWNTAALLLIIIFFLRPLGVFLSSLNSPLKNNEKLFISWVGPRGIVAAGIASLFGTKLTQEGIPGGEFITPLVFSVVLVTVLLNATTARLVARLVGVLKKSDGVMIIGASKASRLIGSYLKQNGRHVVLLDTNRKNILNARKEGLDAIISNIYSDKLEENIEFNDMGFLLALTGNDDINKQAINRYKSIFGENGSFRLINPEELNSEESPPTQDLFSKTYGFDKIDAVARKFPYIHEVPIESKEKFLEFIKNIENDENAIMMFLKDESNHIELLTFLNDLDIDKGCRLVYLGKALEFDEGVNETIIG